MHDTKPDFLPITPLSRREAIGALTAAMIVSGCKTGQTPCPPPSDGGYGRPFDEQNGTDPKQLRATLALWLLFVTNQGFFPVDTKTGKISSALDLASVVKDLQFLPGKDADEQKSILTDLILTINDINQQGQAVNALWTDPSGQDQCLDNVWISYGWALLIVQNLFYSLATGILEAGELKPQGGSPSAYPGGSPYCPKDVKTVLSIATDSPQTPTPQSTVPQKPMLRTRDRKSKSNCT